MAEKIGFHAVNGEGLKPGMFIRDGHPKLEFLDFPKKKNCD